MKWDSEKPFITYEETPNMLLIDYFTYIGGLFGLWFGVCSKNFFQLLMEYFKVLKSYTTILSKYILLLIMKMCEKITQTLIAIALNIYGLIKNLFTKFINYIIVIRNQLL